MRADTRQGPLRVCFVHRRLPHYRLPLFGAIREIDPEIDFRVYCGEAKNGKGGSGVAMGGADPGYVVRVTNWEVGRSGGVEFQPGLVKYLPRLLRMDVVVLEGSIHFLSNVALLLALRFFGRTCIVWVKGWPWAEHEGRFRRAIKKTMIRLASGVITYGHEGRKRLTVAYGGDPARIIVAQNTVDVDRYLAKNPTYSEDGLGPFVRTVLGDRRRVVFCMSRLVAKKRVSDLLMALPVLAETLDLLLVVAGDGPERQRLESLAEDLLPGRSVFMGRVTEDELEALFRASDVCVFPGAVGLALNQAMATARPIVCAGEDGADSELLVHEVNGVRFTPGDTDAMVAAIESVLDSPERSRRLGTRARQTVLASATMELMARSVIGALRGS